MYFLAVLVPSVDAQSFFKGTTDALPSLPLSLPMVAFALSPFLAYVNVTPP